MRAFRYIDSLRGDDARAWLLGIVRNTCFTVLERRRNRPEIGRVRRRRVRGRGSAPPRHRGSDPAALLEQRRLRTLIDAAIRALSPALREVIVLREFEDLDYAQIATDRRGAGGHRDVAACRAPARSCAACSRNRTWGTEMSTEDRRPERTDPPARHAPHRTRRPARRHPHPGGAGATPRPLPAPRARPMRYHAAVGSRSAGAPRRRVSRSACCAWRCWCRWRSA